VLGRHAVRQQVQAPAGEEDGLNVVGGQEGARVSETASGGMAWLAEALDLLFIQACAAPGSWPLNRSKGSVRRRSYLLMGLVACAYDGHLSCHGRIGSRLATAVSARARILTATW
jgi:hypothetical protein